VTPVTTTAATGTSTRQHVLEQYLRKLRAWSTGASSRGDADRPTRIAVGAAELIIEPWDRVQLRSYFDDPSVVSRLVAYGLALSIKSLLDIQRLKKLRDPRSPSVYVLLAELTMDDQFASDLLQEIQQRIEALVAAGDPELARGLTRFKHKLSASTAAARNKIAESEHPGEGGETAMGGGADIARAAGNGLRPIDELARELAREIGGSGPHALPGSRPFRAPQPDIASTDAPTLAPRLSSFRTTPLLVLLGVSILLWIALVLIPGRADLPALPVSQADLPAADVITNIDVSPPSLYFTVWSSAWEAMEPSERRALMDEIANVIAPRGYHGLLVRDESGRPVAQWLKRRGSSMIVWNEQLSPNGPVGQP